MTCDDVRRRLLRCDPAELAGTAGTPLARHLESCEGCRRIAATLLEGERALARALDAAVGGANARRAADRAREAADAASGLSRGGARAAESGGSEPGRRPWRRWVPLAAAAGLALALLLPGGRERTGGPPLTDSPRRPGPSAFSVESDAEGPVTVLQTRDPDVTVVWFHRAPEDRAPERSEP